MQQLEKRIRIAAPQIKALLDVEKEKLDQVKEQLKDMIGKQFDNISIGATKAHRTIKTYVQDKWEPAFKRAKKETGTSNPLLQFWRVANGSNRKGKV